MSTYLFVRERDISTEYGAQALLVSSDGLGGQMYKAAG